MAHGNSVSYDLVINSLNYSQINLPHFRGRRISVYAGHTRMDQMAFTLSGDAA